jgi:hypothetical protein
MINIKPKINKSKIIKELKKIALKRYENNHDPLEKIAAFLEGATCLLKMIQEKTPKDGKLPSVRKIKHLIVEANKEGEVFCPYCRKPHSYDPSKGDRLVVPYCDNDSENFTIARNLKSYCYKDGYVVTFKKNQA